MEIGQSVVKNDQKGKVRQNIFLDDIFFLQSDAFS